MNCSCVVPGVWWLLGDQDEQSSGESWPSGSTKVVVAGDVRSWVGRREGLGHEPDGRVVERNVSQMTDAVGASMEDLALGVESWPPSQIEQKLYACQGVACTQRCRYW